MNRQNQSNIHSLMSDQIGDSQPKPIAKKMLELPPHLKQVLNELAKQMPSSKTLPPGVHFPIDYVSLLNPDEIIYLQAYLNQSKHAKLNKLAQPCMNPKVNGQNSPNVKPLSLDEPNLLNSIEPSQITYLQLYLEQIKTSKIDSDAQQNNYKFCMTIGSERQSCRPEIPINTWQSPVNNYNRQNEVFDPISRDVPIPTDRVNSINSRIWSTADGLTTVPIDTRGSAMTRLGKKGNQPIQPIQSSQSTQYYNTYYNTYEVGARQNEFGSTYKPTYTGPYNNAPDLLDEMGLSPNLYWETFPGDIRNVNLESALLQREMTHIPGQRELTERELNRFELLPFDPQDTRHIIWYDNMPRGGYPSRVDRLESL